MEIPTSTSAPPPTPTPDRLSTHHALRISRVPSKPVLRESDGNLAIALWLQRDGKFDADLALRLTPAEAELLHAQLCFALDNAPRTYSPGYTPDCGMPQGSPGVHWS